MSDEGTSVRTQLSPCQSYSSWPTLTLLPRMPHCLLFFPSQNPQGSARRLGYLLPQVSPSIHRASDNCVCRTEVDSRQVFHTPFSQGGEGIRCVPHTEVPLPPPSPQLQSHVSARAGRQGLALFQGNHSTSSPLPALEGAASSVISDASSPLALIPQTRFIFQGNHTNVEWHRKHHAYPG